MTKIKTKWQGHHADRYSREPLERLFAEKWQEQNRGRCDWFDAHNFTLSATVKERKWVNTLVQWLGSPVGQGFLEDVLHEACVRGISTRSYAVGDA